MSLGEGALAPGDGAAGFVLIETPHIERVHLETFFASVLSPSIPAEELMTLEEILDAYLGIDAEPAALLLDAGQPVAGSLAEIYPTSGVLLLAYLAVAPGYRGRGCGSILMDHTMQTWQSAFSPALTLAEVDDPRFHPADEGFGDPVARLRFYGRWGARLIVMPYFQPSLRPDAPRRRHMFLIAFGAEGEAVAGDAVGSFLREYVELCEGSDALRDAEVRALLGWTESARIELWPVDRFDGMPSNTGRPG